MAEDQPTSPISPNILHSLGISEEDVQSHDKEVLELKKSGADKYRRLLKDPWDTSDQDFKDWHAANDERRYMEIGSLGTIDLDNYHLNIGEIPDQLIEHFFKEPFCTVPSGSGSLRKIPISETQLKIWIEGFGEEALKNGDWKVAIVAYDVATGGNIMSRSDVMQALRGITERDKSNAVEAAKTIQTRINRRQANLETTPAPSPTS